MKKFAIAALLVGLVAGVSAPPAIADPSVVDVTKPMIGVLKQCKTASELDCVESLSYLDADGTPHPMQAGAYEGEGLSVGQNETVVENGQQRYSSGSKTAAVRAELESPAHVLGPSVNGSTPQLGSALRVWVQDLRPDDRTIYTVKVRTSWLKPEDVQLLVNDAGFDHVNIPGGQRWTLTGSQQTVGGYNSDWDAKMKAEAPSDWESQRLVFFLHHAGVDSQHSYFDPRCASKGYPVRSFNAPGAGLPFWNPATQSLDFGITSPHADPRGVPYVGHFRLWVPTAYIDCMYPTNGITNSLKISVIVEDSTGEQQVADTVVKNDGTTITVVADNFHYSSPIIKIKGSGAAKAVTGSVSDAKTFCKPKSGHGKSVLVAIGKKCPKGYIKK